MYEARQNKEKVSRRIDSLKKTDSNACFLPKKTLQLATAHAKVDVSYIYRDTQKTVTEEADGQSGKEQRSNPFANYFVNEIPAMTLEDIAYEDRWSKELKERKNLTIIRNAIHCAEPDETLTALLNIKNSLNKQYDIGNVEISGINVKINNIKEGARSMAPCAVCKQWLKKYSDTEYINRYDLDWLKNPLCGFTLRKPVRMKWVYDEKTNKYFRKRY